MIEIPALFTKEDAWFGGYYELAIELGSRSDSRLKNALESVWSHPDLEGCYLDRNREPSQQTRVASSEGELEGGAHLGGVATLPSGHRVACGTVPIREDDGPDWLDFYLPMGSLSDACETGGYPFDSEDMASHPWRKPLDDWLAALGAQVYSSVRYRLGLIGHEVSGDAYADELAQRGIPEVRRIGYLWPIAGRLEYFAVNG